MLAIRAKFAIRAAGDIASASRVTMIQVPNAALNNMQNGSGYIKRRE